MRVKLTAFVVYPLVFNALVMASDTGGQSSGGSVFSGYPGESIWTLVWFVVLIIALGKFAWKPLLKGLKAREEHISSEITKAEQKNEQAQQKLQDYEKKMQSAEGEAKKIADKELEKARQQAGEILDSAKKDADGIKHRAKDDIKKAVESAKKNLWSEAGDMVYMLSSEIFGKTISDEENQKLIDEAVEKFKNAQETA